MGGGCNVEVYGYNNGILAPICPNVCWDMGPVIYPLSSLELHPPATSWLSIIPRIGSGSELGPDFPRGLDQKLTLWLCQNSY